MDSSSGDPPLSSFNDAVTLRPAEKTRGGFDRWWLLVFAILAIVALMVTLSPDPYRNILIYVREGIWITIKTTVISFLLTLVLGLIGGLGRLSKNWLIHGIATLYVELIRGIPLLVQIFFWYFAFPSIIQSIGERFNIPAFENYLANPEGMAILGITFCYGAYMSEVYRAGIQSIPKGQMEAARSLGMNYVQSMRYVILPQAVRVILPPVGNEFISLLKDSSLISTVAVADMARRGREYMSTHFNPIETWTMIGLLYLVMTTLSARIVFWIERKTRLEK